MTFYEKFSQKGSASQTNATSAHEKYTSLTTPFISLHIQSSYTEFIHPNSPSTSLPSPQLSKQLLLLCCLGCPTNFTQKINYRQIHKSVHPPLGMGRLTLILPLLQLSIAIHHKQNAFESSSELIFHLPASSDILQTKSEQIIENVTPRFQLCISQRWKSDDPHWPVLFLHPWRTALLPSMHTHPTTKLN